MSETLDPVAIELDQKELAKQLLAQAKEQGVELVGPNGLLNQLTKNVLETALDAEMSEHLGYDKHDPAVRGSGNSRNGTRAKTMLTEIGPVEIDVPRDTGSSFEPQIVKKRQRRLTGIDEIALSWTAKGLTTGEGAKFWLSVLTEIKNRGTADVCIVVGDGLKGLPEAINTVWDRAVIQTCVIHLLHNTFRYAARKCWDQIAKGIRPVYTALTETAAKERFVEFTPKWAPSTQRLAGSGRTPGANSCPSWTTTWKSVGSSAAPRRSSRSTPATGAPSGHGAIFGPNKLP